VQHKKNLDGVGVAIIFKIGYASTTPLGGETASSTIARRQAPTARLPPIIAKRRLWVEKSTE